MKNNQQITFRKPFGNALLMSVMAVLGAFITSCGGGTSSAPQHVKLIPKNAAIVVAFDVKQMVGKSVSFEDLFSQKSLEAMGSNEKEAKEGEATVPLILLTNRVQEKKMTAAIAKIESLDSISAPVMRIRVESLK